MARTPAPRKTINRANGAFSHAKTDAAEADEGIDEEEGADNTPAGPAPVDSLSEMLAGLAGASTSRMTVYRITKNQPPSYVFECDPTSFSMDDLRDKYNGGEFRLYIMKDGRLWKNMRVVVEPKQMIHSHDPMPPVNTPTAELLAVMREGFASQAAVLRDVLGSRNGGVGSLLQGADLPAIITAAAAAITALRPPAPPPASDTSSQALDMFMRGLELARELRDDAPSGDNSFGGMLRDVLKSPIVAAAVQGSMPQAVQQTAQISHAKTPSAPPIPQPVPQQPAAQQPADMLAYYLGFLVNKAQAGADPELYAEMVLDNLSDDQLIPMVNRGPALIDDFINLNPAVAQHRDWFVKLIESVSNALEPDDAPETPQQPKGNDAPDPTPNVVPGQPA